MKVRKAIIPSAGRGASFLPATKAQLKEMLPIVGKPMIQYVVEEAAVSGLEEIIIIVGRGKGSIKAYFDKYYEWADTLLKKEQLNSLPEIQQKTSLVKIYYTFQVEPKGLGNAVLCAKSIEPFAVLLNDDVVMSETPCKQQLMRDYGIIQAKNDYDLKRNDLREDVLDFLLEKLNLNRKFDLT